MSRINDIKSIIITNRSKNLQNKLIHGIFWNFIATIISMLLPLIASIFAARILGKVGYGEFAIIYSTIVLFSSFAGLGLGITATKYIAEFISDDKEKVGRIIGLNTLIGIISSVIFFSILFLFAPFLASNFLGNINLTIELQIASFLIITGTFIGIFNGCLIGLGEFKKIARINAIQGLISFPLTLIGVYLFNLTGLLSAYVIVGIFTAVLYKIVLNKLTKKFGINISYRSWSERKMIWQLSIPSLLSNITVIPVTWIANLIIINTSQGYAQLGLFNVADQWRAYLLVLPNIIGTVLIPLLASEKGNNKLETINIVLTWILVIIFALPLITFPEIVGFLYGNDYSSNIFFQVFSIMILVSCIYTYNQSITRKLIVNNLMWWGLVNNLFWDAFFLISIITLKNDGALGLSLSYLIAYGLTTLIFVPFFIIKKVVPKNIILSKELIVIWILLILLTSISILNFSIIIRSIILFMSIIIIIILVNSIKKSYN